MVTLHSATGLPPPLGDAVEGGALPLQPVAELTFRGAAVASLADDRHESSPLSRDPPAPGTARWDELLMLPYRQGGSCPASRATSEVRT